MFEELNALLLSPPLLSVILAFALELMGSHSQATCQLRINARSRARASTKQMSKNKSYNSAPSLPSVHNPNCSCCSTWKENVLLPPCPLPSQRLHIWDLEPAKEVWKWNLRCAELLHRGKWKLEPTTRAIQFLQGGEGNWDYQRRVAHLWGVSLAFIVHQTLLCVHYRESLFHFHMFTTAVGPCLQHVMRVNTYPGCVSPEQLSSMCFWWSAVCSHQNMSTGVL